MSNLQGEVLERLIQSFPNFSFMELRDMSDRHRDHFSVHPDKQSHFALVIEDHLFEGMTHLERHRHVNKVLGGFMDDIHALQMQLKLPGE